MNKGLLVVISGPSGAGKGTIYGKVIEQTGMKRSVSVTTRKPRPGEVEGVNYYFRTEEQYQQMIASGEFLETAAVYNNFYGTPKAPVFSNLESGYDVLFEVDVHGAKSIKSKYPEAVTIFLMTPDFDTLEARLKSRGTESASALKMRLDSARNELAKYEMFDYIVFNDTVEQATAEVISIIGAEKHKVKNNIAKINALLAQKR
ncbi:MAG: guanylate kinase [Clostridia bacterium]|jgi:guanylate kinase|nr:guanylate kinase [Clostridia bacterium]MCI9459829.1 guanylate kinase [Clostridia bacterium]